MRGEQQMKMGAAAYQMTIGLGALSGVVDLVMPAARLIWSEGPQLADWIEMFSGLVAFIASATV